MLVTVGLAPLKCQLKLSNKYLHAVDDCLFKEKEI